MEDFSFLLIFVSNVPPLSSHTGVLFSVFLYLPMSEDAFPSRADGSYSCRLCSEQADGDVSAVCLGHVHIQENEIHQGQLCPVSSGPVTSC